MTSLLDIAPLTAKVKVGGAGDDVDVYGVSVEGLVSLISRFPEVRQLLGGGKGGAGLSEKELLALGGKVVAAVIAAGCGMPGNKEAEEVAAKFNLDTQADFISKILGLTLPNGLAPFVEKLLALGATIGIELDEEEASSKVPVTKSRKRSLNSSSAAIAR